MKETLERHAKWVKDNFLLALAIGLWLDVIIINVLNWLAG